MNPLNIIERYYSPQTKVHEIILTHSNMVMEKAVSVASKFPDVDLDFIREASLLHDIGIIFTNAPGIDCHGKYHYLCHGYLGREILEREGLDAHALVCERHTGVGIRKEEIIASNLPLPHRDMVPISLEEKIICYADNFFSKNIAHLKEEKSIEAITKHLGILGQDKVETFLSWHQEFSL
ncbi:HD domain-containing protein [Candidatus Uabimicrobium amorphum]|uniref:HD family phosphohydrolase n=1 Tax=Uabimicrobium amorphum TaxID=2596890 RepID=A0A5S9F2F9_UABAM|nr:HD domain-containing protein [Candidatus Uabimicrobium amorphum]BBM82419.1 HD family phosphohydrolase [Candidatus Uabimicrobium amorphum]